MNKLFVQTLSASVLGVLLVACSGSESAPPATQTNPQAVNQVATETDAETQVTSFNTQTATTDFTQSNTGDGELVNTSSSTAVDSSLDNSLDSSDTANTDSNPLNTDLIPVDSTNPSLTNTQTNSSNQTAPDLSTNTLTATDAGIFDPIVPIVPVEPLDLDYSLNVYPEGEIRMVPSSPFEKKLQAVLYDAQGHPVTRPDGFPYSVKYSSNSERLTVEATGRMHAHTKEGANELLPEKVTVTISVPELGLKTEREVSIYVLKTEYVTIKLHQLLVDKDHILLEVGQTDEVWINAKYKSNPVAVRCKSGFEVQVSDPQVIKVEDRVEYDDEKATSIKYRVLSLTAQKPGKAIITASCDNVPATPIMVEVRGSLFDEIDFNLGDDFAVTSAQDQTAYLYYQDNKLQLLTSNNGQWQHEELPFVVADAHNLQIQLDRANDLAPLICYQTATQLQCKQKLAANWEEVFSHTIGDNYREAMENSPAYLVKVQLEQSITGLMYLAFNDNEANKLMVAASYVADRSQWQLTTVTDQPVIQLAMATVEDGSARVGYITEINVNDNPIKSAFFAIPNSRGSGWDRERITAAEGAVDIEMTISKFNQVDMLYSNQQRLVWSTRQNGTWLSEFPVDNVSIKPGSLQFGRDQNGWLTGSYFDENNERRWLLNRYLNTQFPYLEPWVKRRFFSINQAVNARLSTDDQQQLIMSFVENDKLQQLVLPSWLYYMAANEIEHYNLQNTLSTKKDSDRDGIRDSKDSENVLDVDNDQILNRFDSDIDGDGYDNLSDRFVFDVNEWADLDRDGIGDNADADRDADGINNAEDMYPDDSDNDGVINEMDTDDDNDGVADTDDQLPLNADRIYYPLHDSGLQTCTDGSEQHLDCNMVNNVLNQDANLGLDALAQQGKMQKKGSGRAGFDFSKLDENGDAYELPMTAIEDLEFDEDGNLIPPDVHRCTVDHLTGLVWEVKHGLMKNAEERQLGNFTQQYTLTELDAYVQKMNENNLCGYNDWRLPEIAELRSLVDMGILPHMFNKDPRISEDPEAVYWGSYRRLDPEFFPFALGVTWSRTRMPGFEPQEDDSDEEAANELPVMADPATWSVWGLSLDGVAKPLNLEQPPGPFGSTGGPLKLVIRLVRGEEN